MYHIMDPTKRIAKVEAKELKDVAKVDAKEKKQVAKNDLKKGKIGIGAEKKISRVLSKK